MLENLHHDFYVRHNWLKVKEKFKQNPKRNSPKVKCLWRIYIRDTMTDQTKR